MATELKMPQMGYDMQQGTVVRWLKSEGAAVQQGEPIVETYGDAIGCFLRTGLDALILDDVLVERTEATPTHDAAAWEAEIAKRVQRSYNGLIERFCDAEAYVVLGEKLAAEECTLGEVE